VAVTINVPTPSLTSWQPKLVALLTFIAAAYQVYVSITGPLHLTFTQAVTNPMIMALLLNGILGLVTKQSGVTGGNIPATPEAKARVAADTGAVKP
jgi:hypothetical protein